MDRLLFRRDLDALNALQFLYPALHLLRFGRLRAKRLMNASSCSIRSLWLRYAATNCDLRSSFCARYLS